MFKLISKKACPTTSLKQGFTLLEILLVVGIIAILTGIVILAINPARQLAQTRNTERLSDIKQINNAIIQYYIDNNVYPSDVSTTTLTEICDTGTATSTTVFPAGYCDNLTDLTLLVPTYVVSMPIDPQGPVISFLDNLITKVFAATNGTGYYTMAEDNKVILTAPRAELNQVITIGTTTMIGFTLTFNSQGGSSVSPITEIIFGNTVTLPDEPTKNGYTFEGWYTEVDGGGTQFTESTAVTASITVYAKWVVVPFACGDNVTFTYKGSSVTYGTVSNSTTSECWLDRNLGATRVAISSTDTAAYGDLFQWGRPDDGHQTRTSGTQTGPVATITPGTNTFIIPNSDWSSIDSDGALRSAYLAKTDGTGICPSGFRVPTDAELNAERLSWSSNNSAGAFASPLKLTVAGGRLNNTGALFNVDQYGYYWSNIIDITNSRYLRFFSDNANIYSNNRAYGFTVRCLKD